MKFVLPDIRAAPFAGALTLLFPRNCLVCGRGVPSGYLCSRCVPRAPYLGPTCLRCHSPSYHSPSYHSPAQAETEHQCPNCHLSQSSWNQMRFLWPYESKARALLRVMKYQPSARLTRWAGDELMGAAPKLWSIFRAPKWDILVQIPSSKRSLIRREFCVTALLAKQLTGLADTWAPTALGLDRNTAPQARLSPERRINNVRGAFKADSEVVDGASILLIDDVVTTGATINEACKTLRLAGARSVDVYALARSDRWTR